MSMCLVYMTTSTTEEAQRLGRHLVEARFAACVNIIPGMRSIYRWQGAIEEASEAVLIAKTSATVIESLIAEVKKHHSYTVPCVIALPVMAGNQDYLAWLAAGLIPPAEDATPPAEPPR